MPVVDLAQKFDQIVEPWSPHIVGALNGQHVKLAKLSGEFVWHCHEDADELFFVVRGELHLHLPDRVEIVRPGQLFIVPKGVRHKPVAIDEVHVMLFEPAGTVNTGDVGGERTNAAKWM